MAEFPVIGALAFAGGWMLLMLAAYWLMFHVGPRRRRDAEQAAETPEEPPADEHVDERHAWTSHVKDAVLLTHENRADEETNDTAADILLWEDECLESKRIARLAALLAERAER